MEQPNTKNIMNLIVNAGAAKSCAMEAIQLAKKNQLTAALTKMDSAKSFLNKAHNQQSQLLFQEAKGANSPVTLLGVHAQDHLMTAITFCDLAQEIINLYQTIFQLKKE